MADFIKKVIKNDIMLFLWSSFAVIALVIVFMAGVRFIFDDRVIVANKNTDKISYKAIKQTASTDKLKDISKAKNIDEIIADNHNDEQFKLIPKKYLAINNAKNINDDFNKSALLNDDIKEIKNDFDLRFQSLNKISKNISEEVIKTNERITRFEDRIELILKKLEGDRLNNEKLKSSGETKFIEKPPSQGVKGAKLDNNQGKKYAISNVIAKKNKGYFAINSTASIDENGHDFGARLDGDDKTSKMNKPKALANKRDINLEDSKTLIKPNKALNQNDKVNITRYAVYVGSSSSVDFLKLHWNQMKDDFGDDLKSLKPLYQLTKNNQDKLLYKLVAGPFKNIEQAIELCIRIINTGAFCNQDVFEGSPLM